MTDELAPKAPAPQPEVDVEDELSIEPNLVTHPAILGLTGLAFSVGAFVSYFALLGQPTVRATAWPTFAMMTLGVVLATASVGQRRRWWTFALATLNGGTVASFVYLFFFAFALPLSSESVKLADKAPDFTLLDHNARPVSLSSYRGKGPVLLLFYRGHW